VGFVFSGPVAAGSQLERRVMIIVLKPQATPAHARELLDRIAALGLRPLHMPGAERVVLGALGDERVLEGLHLDGHPMVESVKPILAPYKLVSRDLHPADTVVSLGGVDIGGERVVVMAGPCAVESRDQLTKTATAVAEHGARVLRGGAFKPRTSPYSFQGLGAEGLALLHEVGRTLGIPTLTEVVEAADLELVDRYADGFQLGARNMQNFRLLKALGQSRKPILLKRGPSARIEDFLLAAEYILAEGNPNVILCERGIQGFDPATRNVLDLAAVPAIKARSHLPVVVDPSHGTGVRDLVAPMAKAAIACGADGLLIEVHHDPAAALSDGPQSLYPEQFAKLMRELGPIGHAAGRSL
jgi:3-deoxy-7-phosphoheptulonate synthase